MSTDEEDKEPAQQGGESLRQLKKRRLIEAKKEAKMSRYHGLPPTAVVLKEEPVEELPSLPKKSGRQPTQVKQEMD